MRVRKINQVDVKLHDLTKVKLKTTGNTLGFLINWEEEINGRIKKYIN